MRRMGAYFAEMFPLPTHLAVAVLIYGSVASFARVIHDVPSTVLSWYAVVGVWSYFSITLILRLMDELKDEDIDAALFADRALPSGRVYKSDIQLSLCVVIAVYLAVNLTAGAAFWVGLAILGYAFLMFHWFFARSLLQGSLLITLATHNPIVPMIILYGFVLFASEHGMALGTLRWELIVPFAVMLWSPFLAWELARKIRPEEEEDAYETYSKIFGRPGAVLAVVIAQGVSLVAVAWLWRSLSLSAPYLAIPVAAYAAFLFAGMRFVLWPGSRTAKLRPFAEAFIVCMLATQILEFGWA